MNSQSREDKLAELKRLWDLSTTNQHMAQERLKELARSEQKIRSSLQYLERALANARVSKETFERNAKLNKLEECSLEQLDVNIQLLKKAAMLDISTERPGRSARSERPGRSERSERPERSVQSVQSEQPEQPERSVQPVQPERPERSVQPVQPERPERSERSVQPERPEPPERSVQPVQPERPGRSARSERPERSVQPERPVRPERSERSVQPERPVRPERSERSVQPVQPERSERSVQPVQPERPVRPERSEPSVQPERPEQPEQLEIDDDDDEISIISPPINKNATSVIRRNPIKVHKPKPPSTVPASVTEGKKHRSHKRHREEIRDLCEIIPKKRNSPPKEVPILLEKREPELDIPVDGVISTEDPAQSACVTVKRSEVVEIRLHFIHDPL